VGEAGSGEAISVATVLAQVPTTLERRSSSAVVLLADRPPIVLKGTGIDVWDAFAGPRSVGDAARALADEYCVPFDRVLHDMLPVVDELCRAGALCSTSAEDSG
jgi:hypothetical protein